jgi:hypothetical protein
MILKKAIIIFSRLMSGTEQNNSTSSFLPYFSKWRQIGFTVLIIEMDWDPAAMVLPPVTFAVLF